MLKLCRLRFEQGCFVVQSSGPRPSLQVISHHSRSLKVKAHRSLCGSSYDGGHTVDAFAGGLPVVVSRDVILEMLSYALVAGLRILQSCTLHVKFVLVK